MEAGDAWKVARELQEKLNKEMRDKAELEARVSEMEATDNEEVKAAKDQRLVDLEGEVVVAMRKIAELEGKLRLANQVGYQTALLLRGGHRPRCVDVDVACTLRVTCAFSAPGCDTLRRGPHHDQGRKQPLF